MALNMQAAQVKPKVVSHQMRREGQMRNSSALGLYLFVCLGPASVSGQDLDMWDISRARRLTHVEVGRIGGYDDRPPYVLSGVGSVTVLSSSKIALVDFASREVRMFSAKGVFERRFGGRGEGPGEFRMLLGVAAMRAERLLTWELGVGRRFSLFTEQGQHLYSRPYEPPANVGSIPRTIGGTVMQAPAWVVHGGGQSFVGVFEDGRAALQEARPPDMTPGPRRDTVRFVVYDLEQKASRVLGTVRAGDATYGGGGGMISITAPLFDRAAVAAARGNELVFGFTGEAALQRVSANGERLSSWPFRARQRSVSAAEVRAERTRLIGELRDNEFREGLRQNLESAPAHTTLPEFRAILAGTDGTLWMEDYPKPGAIRVRWYQIENGVAVSWFDAPSSARVSAIGHGLAIGVERDQLGVETVVIWSLSR